MLRAMRATSSFLGRGGRTARACPYPYSCSCHRPRLCVCDVARAHPTQHFARWLDCRHISTCRPVPELFFVLVSNPPRLIAALLGNVGEHAVPFGLIEHAGLGPAALDETEIAIDVRHVFRRTLGHEAAVRTRLATDTQRSALRAFNELALVAALPF